MYVDIIDKLKEMPVFGMNDVRKFLPSTSDYFISKLLDEEKIIKLKKNAYSFHRERFLIANYLVMPSYVSSYSALSYHNAVSVLPFKTVVSFTTKKTTTIDEYIYHNTKYFFGFNTIKKGKYNTKIATIEKAILDSFNVISLEYFVEAFDRVNVSLLTKYLTKYNSASLNKRVGYILEKKGIEIDLNYNDYNYVLLDPLGNKNGEKNEKWHIINNYGDVND